MTGNITYLSFPLCSRLRILWKNWLYNFSLATCMKKCSFEKLIIQFTIIAGILIALLQFIYNRSLWLDEASLALNIIHKNHLELLKPLDYGQVAPILFLQIEKLFSELIPNTEFGLRLFPLLSFIFSLFFLYKIIKTFNLSDYSIIFIISLFVFNSTLIYYTSEVKQYMSDVLVITSVYYLLLKTYDNNNYKYYFLGIVGSICIFLSNITPVILFSVGLYLFFDIYINKKKQLLQIISLSSFWILSFLTYYFLFIEEHPSRSFMTTYWSNMDAFMPLNPLSKEFYHFTLKSISRVFFELFQFGGLYYFLIFLFLIGLISLIRDRKISIIILTVTPLLLHLIISGFKLYPFYVRLILYTIPCIGIICSIGFDRLVKMFLSDLNIKRFRMFAVFIPFILFSYLIGNGFPQEFQEIKKSYRYIQRHSDKNDKIYVHYEALPQFTYYVDIHYISNPTSILIGSSDIENKENFISEFQKLQGRNWLLFSNISNDKVHLIVHQLDSLGYSKIESFETNMSSTYLFDFRN